MSTEGQPALPRSLGVILRCAGEARVLETDVRPAGAAPTRKPCPWGIGAGCPWVGGLLKGSLQGGSQGVVTEDLGSIRAAAWWGSLAPRAP